MATFTDWLKSIGLAGFPISQQFGANAGLHGYGAAGHGGTDVAAPLGTPLKVPAGVVRVQAGQDLNSQGQFKGWGNYLRLFFADGSWSQLSHLSQFVGIKPGQTISSPVPGTVYGLSGSTGNSTGPHVDIERRTATGQRANPASAVYPIAQAIYPTAQQAAQYAAAGTPLAPYITPDGTPPGPGLTAISEGQAAQMVAPGSVWQRLGVNVAGLLLVVVLFGAGIYLTGRSF